VVCATLAVTHFLAVELSLLPLLCCVAFGLAFTGGSYFYANNSVLISSNIVLYQLLFDALLVTVLVYFSGRSANPFIYYWLVLVAISATIFSQKIAVAFTCFTVFLYSAMLYLDFESHIHHLDANFQLHLVGMWINFCGSAFLITLFISRLAILLRHRQALLSEARENTLKNEQLVGIGTLAASTVHSLGTPLSSLALLTEELSEQASTQDERELLDTMQNQISRCKKTMAEISQLADRKNIIEVPRSIFDILAALEEHYKLTGASPMPTFTVSSKEPNIYIEHNLLLSHALINLIDNAISAAKSYVEISVRVEGPIAQLSISDDGEGMPEEIAKFWGETVLPSSNEGLGIGALLANSTIEKLGGEIKVESQQHSRQSTKITVSFPLTESRPQKQ